MFNALAAAPFVLKSSEFVKMSRYQEKRTSGQSVRLTFVNRKQKASLVAATQDVECEGEGVQTHSHRGTLPVQLHWYGVFGEGWRIK